MYKSINIKNRILATIADRGLNKTMFLKNAGLPETTLRNMDNSFPSVEKIAIIANHLDVSVDYLLGRQVSTPELETRRFEFIKLFDNGNATPAELNAALKTFIAYIIYDRLNDNITLFLSP